MDNNGSSFNIKRISVGGILLALTVLTLYLQSVIPVNELSLLVLSSFFVSVIVVEFGAKSGWVFYFSSVVLSLMIVGDKLGLLPYVLFFGLYGIMKYYIEVLNRLFVEYLLKIVFFNIYILLSYLLLGRFLPETIRLNLPWELLLAAFEIAFIVYDYVYTLFVQYYKNVLKKMFRV